MKKHVCNCGPVEECKSCRPWPAPDAKKRFRWILRLPGIEPHLVRSIQSLPGKRLEVTLLWLQADPWPAEPTSRTGQLMLLDAQGGVTSTYDLEWDAHELLPFDLDYGSSEIMSPRLLMSGVKITPV